MDTVTLAPMLLSTAPRTWRKIAHAAVPKVVRAISQRLMKMRTAVENVIGDIMGGVYINHQRLRVFVNFSLLS